MSHALFLLSNLAFELPGLHPDFKRTKLSTGMVALFPDAHPRR